MVKRATSLARLVCAGVLLFHHFPRNEIANKNNYVIEIGYKKWERLDFVENLYATIIFYGLYGAFTALLVSSFVPSLSALRLLWLSPFAIIVVECVVHFTLTICLHAHFRLWIKLYLPHLSIMPWLSLLINHSFVQIKILNPSSKSNSESSNNNFWLKLFNWRNVQNINYHSIWFGLV